MEGAVGDGCNSNKGKEKDKKGVNKRNKNISFIEVVAVIKEEGLFSRITIDERRELGLDSGENDERKRKG